MSTESELPADPNILPCTATMEVEGGRVVPVPQGWTPFPANPPPEKVGTRPQLTSELHVACFDKDASRVERLLADGSASGNAYRANAVDVGSTPLALAMRRPAKNAEEDGRIAAIARMLLDAGAELEGGEGEDSPLVLACIAGGGASGKAQTVQVLVDAGANLRARCRTLKMTPLHWAITCGFADVVDVLLRAGASATSVSGKQPRETPLQLADKALHKFGMKQYVTRTAHDEAEKAAVKEDLVAIRQLVARAAGERSEQKAQKKAQKQSARAA